MKNKLFRFKHTICLSCKTYFIKNTSATKLLSVWCMQLTAYNHFKPQTRFPCGKKITHRQKQFIHKPSCPILSYPILSRGCISPHMITSKKKKSTAYRNFLYGVERRYISDAPHPSNPLDPKLASRCCYLTYWKYILRKIFGVKFSRKYDNNGWGLVSSQPLRKFSFRE